MAAASLHDEPPGAPCEQCAAQQLTSAATCPGVTDRCCTQTEAGSDRAPVAYFEQLRASVAQLGAGRWVLTQVMALTGQASELTDEQLRRRLAVLAHQARHARCPVITPDVPDLPDDDG